MHYSMLSAMLALSLTGSLIAQSKAEAGKGSQPKTTTTASTDAESRLPVKRVVLGGKFSAWFRWRDAGWKSVQNSAEFSAHLLLTISDSGHRAAPSPP